MLDVSTAPLRTGKALLNPVGVAQDAARRVMETPQAAIELAAPTIGGAIGSSMTPVIGTGVGTAAGEVVARSIGKARQDAGNPLTLGRAARTIRDVAVPSVMAGSVAAGGDLAIRGIGRFLAAGSRSQAPTIAGRIRDAFAESVKDAGTKYGEAVEQLAKQFPDKRISLREVVDDLNTIRAESPQLMTDLNSAMRRSGNTVLKDLLDHPELADDLDLKQATEFKKSLQKVPGLVSKGKQFGVRYTDTDLDVIHALNKTRHSIGQAFPEMAKINEEFGSTIARYNTLRPRFKQGTLVNQVASDFGDPEIAQMVRELLPKEAVHEMGVLRKSIQARRLAAQAAPGVVGGATAYGLLRLLGSLGQDQ